jgi:hypothetical protein
MASPSNVFDFYDTFLYDVINLTPGEVARPTIPVNQQSLESYLQRHPSLPPHTLRFLHLHNRSLVDLNSSATADLIPLQRQVQGPAEFPDLGFKFLDRTDSAQLRDTQPIVARGEHYYVRISGEKGTVFYDSYARHLLPAAFNHLLERGAGRRTRGVTGVESESPLPPPPPVIERLSVYFSERNAVTSLHYDTSGRGSVLCQLTGAKRIQLWPPGLEEVMEPYQPPTHHFHRRSKFNGRAPQRESREMLERREFNVLLKPGLCIYFPVRWWHHVESLGDENVSTRFTVE